MPESRLYELVYVIAPDVGDDGVAALHTQVEEIVTAGGGEIEKTDNWGRRRLAYEIGRYREGTYVLELIRSPGELVSELDRRLKVSDNILRYLVVRVDEDLRKAERSRARRQARRLKRRGAGSTTPTPSDATPGTESAATAAPSATPSTESAAAAPAPGATLKAEVSE